MRQGKTKVREALGTVYTVPDRAIEDALWNYYYDISKTVSYLKSRRPISIQLFALTFLDKFKPIQPKQLSRFDQAAAAVKTPKVNKPGKSNLSASVFLKIIGAGPAGMSARHDNCPQTGVYAHDHNSRSLIEIDPQVGWTAPTFLFSRKAVRVTSLSLRRISFKIHPGSTSLQTSEQRSSSSRCFREGGF